MTNNSSLQNLRATWHNGGRGFLVAGFVAIIALLALSTSLLGVTLSHQLADKAKPPLEFGHVEIRSPVVPVGGIVLIHGTVCNNTDKPLDASFRHSYFGRTAEGDIRVIEAENGVYTHPPGCMTYDAELDLPPTIDPGRWYASGVSDYSYQGIDSTTSWRTNTFEVVP